MNNLVNDYHFYCMEKTKIFRKFTKKMFFTVEFAVDVEILPKLCRNHCESFINFAANFLKFSWLSALS